MTSPSDVSIPSNSVKLMNMEQTRREDNDSRATAVAMIVRQTDRRELGIPDATNRSPAPPFCLPAIGIQKTPNEPT